MALVTLGQPLFDISFFFCFWNIKGNRQRPNNIRKNCTPVARPAEIGYWVLSVHWENGVGDLGFWGNGVGRVVAWGYLSSWESEGNCGNWENWGNWGNWVVFTVSYCPVLAASRV